MTLYNVWHSCGASKDDTVKISVMGVTTVMRITVMTTMSVKVPVATAATGSVMSVMAAMSITLLVVMASRPDAHNEGFCIRLRLVCRQKTAASR